MRPNSILLAIAVLGLPACSDGATSLPGGYAVRHGDRGKAWLQNADGTMAHDGLIKDLYRDNSRILLVADPTSYGGQVVPPTPIDRSCYVALLFDASTPRSKQVSLAQAERLSAHMIKVESYERPCLRS